MTIWSITDLTLGCTFNPVIWKIYQNSTEYLQKHLVQLLENLKNIEHAPSVAQFQRPPDHFTADPDHDEDEDDMDPDTRTNRDDKHVYDARELFDDEDKRTDPEKDRASYKEKDKAASTTHATEPNEGPEAMDTVNDTEESQNSLLSKPSQDTSPSLTSTPPGQTPLQSTSLQNLPISAETDGVQEPRGETANTSTDKMDLI